MTYLLIGICVYIYIGLFMMGLLWLAKEETEKEMISPIPLYWPLIPFFGVVYIFKFILDWAITHFNN